MVENCEIAKTQKKRRKWMISIRAIVKKNILIKNINNICKQEQENYHVRIDKNQED